MSEAGLLPAAQSQALLHEIEQQTHDDCRNIASAAEREARAIVARTHATARRRMHEAVVDLRREGAHRRMRAAAQRETERRMQGQRRNADRIRRAWPLLIEALAARWSDPVARGAWIAAAGRFARTRLKGRAWVIRHPAAWSADDSRHLIEALSEGTRTDFLVDDQLRAGVKLEVGQSTLDASLDGLLADRSAIAARLLAEIERGARGRS